MNANKIKILSLGIIYAICVLLYAFSTIAEPLVNPPHQFHGEVTVDNNPVADNILVEAEIDGEGIVAATKTADGMYNLKIPDPFGTRTGETIKFYVNNIDTEQTSTYGGSGSITELNLALADVEFCGDGTCSGDESCENCQADCGKCDGGGGNGGSHHTGGSYVPPTDDNSSSSDCTPAWECTKWFDCVSSVQQRICVDHNLCGTDEGKPPTVQDCEVPEELKSSSSSENDNNKTALVSNEPFNEDNVDLLDGSNNKDKDGNGFLVKEGMLLGGIASPLTGIIVIAAIIVVGLLVFIYFNRIKK